MPFPREPGLPLALVVTSAALGAVVLLIGGRWLLVRRRALAKGSGETVDRHALLPVPDEPDPAAFYRTLLGAVRHMLDGRADVHGHSLTARELGCLLLDLYPDAPYPERWGRLCARAEWAQFGGGQVDIPRRTEDLQFVGELLAHPGRRAEPGSE